jgi:hypothetical protein
VRLAPISMALLALIPAFADTHTLDKEKGAATLATNGIELPTVSTVQDSVEIANTYAVVQLTTSKNKPDAVFVVHSAEMRGN